MIALNSVSYKSLRRGNSLPIGCLPKLGVFSPPIFDKRQDVFLSSRVVGSFGARKTRLYVFVIACRRKFRNLWKPDHMFLSSLVVGNFGILKTRLCVFICGVNTKTYVNEIQNSKYYGKRHFENQSRRRKSERFGGATRRISWRLWRSCLFARCLKGMPTASCFLKR